MLDDSSGTRDELLLGIDDDDVCHRSTRGVEHADSAVELRVGLDTPLAAVSKRLGQPDVVRNLARFVRVRRLNDDAGRIERVDSSDPRVGLLRARQHVACVAHHGYGQAEINDRLEGIRRRLRDDGQALTNQIRVERIVLKGREQRQDDENRGDYRSKSNPTTPQDGHRFKSFTIRGAIMLVVFVRGSDPIFRSCRSELARERKRLVREQARSYRGPASVTVV